MSKKVLIFSLNYYPRFIGGAEVAIKNITDRIPPEDIEFHMITLRFDSTLPRMERIGNVVVHRIGFTRPNPSMADLKKRPLHWNKYWYQLAGGFAALSLHRTYHYDGIWAMMAHSCAVPAAVFTLFASRVKYLLTLQEGDPPEHIERLARPVWPLFVRGFKRADRIQVISNFLGAWAKRMGYAHDTILIPNAVNVAHFSKTYSEQELDEFREQIGKKKGDVFLISTSRLAYKNATEDVISALPLLPENIKFLADGEGPDIEMLERLAHKLGLAAAFLTYASGEDVSNLSELIAQTRDGSVKLFTLTTPHPRGYRAALYGEGPVLRALLQTIQNKRLRITLTLPPQGPSASEVPSLKTEANDYRVVFFPQTGQEEMPKHLKACDISIRPSRSEGMGNSFLEAMVAGLPVVATPVGGIPDFLFDPDLTPGHEPTGFFAQPNDPKSIAETVTRVLKDPARTASIVAHAKEVASKNYDWPLIADQMKRLFDEMLKSR